MLDAAQKTTRRRMAMMDESGHMTWSWDEANDEQVIPAIQRLMDNGYVFWIVRRDPLREDELEADEINELRENRHIIIKNEDFAELMRAGVMRLTNDDADLTRERRATDAADAAANDTVAHRPLRAG